MTGIGDISKLLRVELKIPDEEKIATIRISTERERLIIVDEAGEGSLLVDPADKHHLAKLDAMKDFEDPKEPEIDIPKERERVKRAYHKRVKPELEEKKKGKPGRKPQFDMNITAVNVSKAKEKLEKLYTKKRLEPLERDRYENLCQNVDVESLTYGQRDKVIALYKEVGRRYGG
jgi:hypothetical protein